MRVKELVTHKKLTKTEDQSDRASTCNINMSFENEGDSNVQSSDDIIDDSSTEHNTSTNEDELEVNSEQNVDKSKTAESTMNNKEVCSQISGITNTTVSSSSEEKSVPSQTEAVP